MDGNARIRAFEMLLTRITDRAAIPPGMPGDLADLLGTLEHGVSLLSGLMVGEFDGEEIARRLLAVQLFLQDDVPMISDDLLPALETVKNIAYDKKDT